MHLHHEGRRRPLDGESVVDRRQPAGLEADVDHDPMHGSDHTRSRLFARRGVKPWRESSEPHESAPRPRACYLPAYFSGAFSNDALQCAEQK